MHIALKTHSLNFSRNSKASNLLDMLPRQNRIAKLFNEQTFVTH